MGINTIDVAGPRRHAPMVGVGAPAHVGVVAPNAALATFSVVTRWRKSNYIARRNRGEFVR
jgi:hypothetical protein